MKKGEKLFQRQGQIGIFFFLVTLQRQSIPSVRAAAGAAGVSLGMTRAADAGQSGVGHLCYLLSIYPNP